MAKPSSSLLVAKMRGNSADHPLDSKLESSLFIKFKSVCAYWVVDSETIKGWREPYTTEVCKMSLTKGSK